MAGGIFYSGPEYLTSLIGKSPNLVMYQYLVKYQPVAVLRRRREIRINSSDDPRKLEN